MNGEKSPNSGIFVSPGSFLWENISLLIHVCSYNGLESLRSFLLRVLLMYSQYTWKVHTNYIQLKGFQNVSPKALPFSSKFPDELPRGWFFNRSKQPPLGNGFPTKVGNVKGCEVMAHRSWISMSLISQYCWSSFHVLVRYLCIISGEMSIQVICLLINLVGFVVVEL